MPQRISDEMVSAALTGEWDQMTEYALLDLRDAREQLKTLKTYGEAKYAAETRLTELLAIALEGLELVADQNDAIYPKQVARTYLDRIKQIG